MNPKPYTHLIACSKAIQFFNANNMLFPSNLPEVYLIGCPTKFLFLVDVVKGMNRFTYTLLLASEISVLVNHENIQSVNISY